MIKFIIIAICTLSYIISVFGMRYVLIKQKRNKPLDEIELIFILTPVLNVLLSICKCACIFFTYSKGKVKLFSKWFMTDRWF